MQNAVIYARYSSRGQNEQTIEGQVRVCKEYAKQLNYNVIKVYADKHKTGTDVNRPEFQKMIEDSKKRKFDYVIVYMLDRFARNRYYSTMYNWELMQNGVKIISATENISESEEGEFYQMFLEWNAERYSKRLSIRIKEGLTTSVANGTTTGGTMIYGYKVENKKVLIDKDNAEVVKYIFEQYAKGVSKQDIANELNKKGLRYNGKMFSPRNFDRMLANTKYIGKFMLGDRLCENTYPRIIDDKTFKAVQERLKINKHNAGANCAKQEYLLLGKAFCGLCGSTIRADGGTSVTGKKYRYYACTGKKKKHNCLKKNEKKDYLEWYVTDQTVKYLSDKKRVELIAKDVVDYFNDKTNSSQIKRLKQEHARVEKEIDNAVNAMVNTSSSVTHKKLDVKINELTI
ncbi:MAG: recombinase family protein, partial [Christensenellales bacterium]